MKELVTVEVEGGLPTHRFDRRAWQRLQRTLLGKTLVFTDNADWSDVEIVRGCAASRRERVPLHEEHPPHLLAAAVSLDRSEGARLLLRPCAAAVQSSGARNAPPRPDDVSVRAANSAQEVGVVYKKPFVRTTLSQMTDDQRTLYETLDLKRYLQLA